MTCSKQIFEYTHKADSANRLTLWYWAKNYSWHIAVTVQKYLLDIAWTLFVRVKIISVFIKNMTVSRTELQIYHRVCKVWKVLLAVEKDDISIVLSLLSIKAPIEIFFLLPVKLGHWSLWWLSSPFVVSSILPSSLQPQWTALRKLPSTAIMMIF